MLKLIKPNDKEVNISGGKFDGYKVIIKNDGKLEVFELDGVKVKENSEAFLQLSNYVASTNKGLDVLKGIDRNALIEMSNKLKTENKMVNIDELKKYSERNFDVNNQRNYDSINCGSGM